VAGSEFQPTGERITADDGGAQRMRLHRWSDPNRGWAA
jgi:hypothetical protein